MAQTIKACEMNNYWINRVFAWWSGFSLRTKLLAIATLVVSLLMTGITFFALIVFKEMQV